MGTVGLGGLKIGRVEVHVKGSHTMSTVETRGSHTMGAVGVRGSHTMVAVGVRESHTMGTVGVWGVSLNGYIEG